MGKQEEEYKAKDVDIRNYARYILSDGTIFEKRDLLDCLKTSVYLREKNLTSLLRSSVVYK